MCSVTCRHYTVLVAALCPLQPQLSHLPPPFPSTYRPCCSIVAVVHHLPASTYHPSIHHSHPLRGRRHGPDCYQPSDLGSPRTAADRIKGGNVTTSPVHGRDPRARYTGGRVGIPGSLGNSRRSACRHRSTFFLPTPFWVTAVAASFQSFLSLPPYLTSLAHSLSSLDLEIIDLARIAPTTFQLITTFLPSGDAVLIQREHRFTFVSHMYSRQRGPLCIGTCS